jgi:hypothetical protein
MRCAPALLLLLCAVPSTEGLAQTREPRQMREEMREQYRRLTGLRVVSGTEFPMCVGTNADPQSCRPSGYVRAQNLDPLGIPPGEQRNDATIAAHVSSRYVGGAWNLRGAVRLSCVGPARIALDSAGREFSVGTDSVGQALRNSVVQSAAAAFEASLNLRGSTRDSLVAAFRTAMERELSQSSNRNARLKWVHVSVPAEATAISSLAACRREVQRGGGIITGVAGLLVIENNATYAAIDNTIFNRAAQAALGASPGPAVLSASTRWTNSVRTMIETDINSHSPTWRFYPIWIRVTA